MKFALLGLDPFTLSLALTLKQLPGYQLTAAYDLDSVQRDVLRSALGSLPGNSAWEELLHASVAETVLIAPVPSGHEEAREQRSEQLRKLAQSGLGLMMVVPACEAIVGYELEMIRRDTSTRILPILPGVPLELVQHLRGLIEAGEAGPLGRAEQVSVERRLLDRDVGQLKDAVSRDAVLLQAVVGETRKVGALGQAFVPGGPFHLSATLETNAEILCRWSVQASSEAEDLRLVLLGTRERVEAVRDRVSGRWLLRGPGQQQQTLEPVDATRATAAAISGWQAGQPQWLSWLDACRAQEVAESMERAAARGKTIELFNEEPTEEGTFKGVMAVGSCGLLMLTLLVLVVGAMIEGLRLPFARRQLRPPVAVGDSSVRDNGNQAGTQDAPADIPPAPAPAMRPLWIRLWPVYPFLAFLFLQLINVLFVRPATAARAPPANEV